ncbi:MAG: DEAD/DEAH box helicase [Chitinophagales bacterium]|nr:DEAD/DEAH box helicase [Chitinophagales bacterium]
MAEEVNSFKGNKRFFVSTVYGGAPIDKQIRDIQKGADIIVGTPGRVIDLIKRNKLKLNDIKYFVLDEADEMLNMGFIEDIEFILSETNDDKQVLLFSATMPTKIMKLAKKYMGEYELVQIEKQTVTTENTEQLYYAVNERDKMAALERIMEMNPDFYGIVFCNTRMGTDDVTRQLNQMGIAAEALHGDVQQNQRERILNRFKSRKCTVLCATDVAARGIDVNELTHVINYQLPQDPEAYVHRIGRTGRAGNKGIAISLISGNEKRQMGIIQSISKAEMKRMEFPSAGEVIKTKIDNYVRNISETEISQDDFNIMRLANELIQANDSTDALVQTLKFFLKNELKEKKIKDLGQPKAFDGKGGKHEDVRLFVAKGKKDRFTKETLEEWICEKTGIAKTSFLDTFLLEEFSFITLEEEDAEMVLAVFGRNKEHGKSIVTKAKKRDNEGFEGGRGRGSRNGGGRSGGERKGGKSSSFGGSKKGRSSNHNAFYSDNNDKPKKRSKLRNAKY